MIRAGQARPAILFVHDHYPGQFGALAAHLHRRGWSVRFATADRHAPSHAPWPVLRYAPHRSPHGATHPYVQGAERAALQGQACIRALMAADLPAPDIIVSHTGPGAGQYLRHIYPRSHIVAYCEWWYRADGPDIRHADHCNGETAQVHPEAGILREVRNAPIATEIANADRALSPTRFQATQFPGAFRDRMTVRHDGVDTTFFAPSHVPPRTPPALGQVPRSAPLLTYATRGMEPYRCFPEVIEAFRILLDRHPSWYAAIIGENRVFYGSEKDRQTDWQTWAEERLGPLRERVCFTGFLQKEAFRDALRRSNAHVYASVPFVLSWSLIEAMALGVPLVASATPPVLEIVDGKLAKLCAPDDPESIARAIEDVVLHPDDAKARGQRARQHALDRYSHERLLPEHEAWLLCGA